MGLIPCTTHAPVAPSTVDLVLRALRSSLGEELRGRRIAVLGLGPADVRLVDSLIGQGAAVSAHDPGCSDGARTWLGNRALLLDDPYLAATEADALVLSTAWSSERPDLERLRGCMARPLLVDARP
ncbi:MAG: hypothetical protein H5U40_17395, partial [Polyangiaceae bacterium]|nr:hypothetical protein [Polyangiaceae bacterium]